MGWSSIVMVVCLVLAVFTIYLEYARSDKARMGWRIIAVIFATAALACIILPLSYSGTGSPAANGKILLTAGFNRDSLPKSDSIYTLNKTVHQQYRKAKLLDNLQELYSDSNYIAPVHVFGYGLDEEELQQLSGRQFIFHSSPIPDGFTSASWTEKIKAGQPFRVQGIYQNTSAKNYKLLLKGLNTSLDSVSMPAKSNTAFTLETTPKNSGRLSYNLIALSSKDTLEQEQLPVIIEPAQPVKVLMLSASPDFETKFLKDWLGGNGYAVASRSNITKGKFGQEYLNMGPTDLTHITTGLLGKFDIVIGDLSVLKSLSPPENSALEQEVSQKGMGIIIRADSSDKKASWLQSNFSTNYEANKLQAPTALSLQNNQKTARLNIDPVYIIPQNNTQPLISDGHNRLLSGIALKGSGKLIFTVINNTYTWALSGNQKDYSALWSLLIGKAARKLPVAGHWLVATSTPIANSPVQLVTENAALTAGVTINSTPVYPVQNPEIPFQQQYIYWPVSYGWQQVIQPNGPPYWWFTWQNNGWLSLNAIKNQLITTRYLNVSLAGPLVTKQIQQKFKVIVPKIYFYILFLVAVTFLWIESKFYSS